MRATVPQPSSNETSTPSIILIPREQLLPNPWNPNRMTAQAYAKLLESIQQFGFIDPLLVREIGYRDFQIIGGAHRFRAGNDLGMEAFPCVNLGLVDDAVAKKLTIIDNELHGQADPTQMGDLLTEILQLTSLEELLVALPYSEDVLAGFIGLPDLPAIGEGGDPTPPPPDPNKEPWVERLYKLPKTAALIVDEAIEKAKDGDPMENWQALERVAADYLAS